MEVALHPAPSLDRAFAALSNPTRRAIVRRLADHDAGVLELAAEFPISQPAVTKHLRVLEAAGLVSRRREAQRRPRHLEAGPLQLLFEWTGGYRRFWEASLARLDEYIDTIQQEDQ